MPGTIQLSACFYRRRCKVNMVALNGQPNPVVLPNHAVVLPPAPGAVKSIISHSGTSSKDTGLMLKPVGLNALRMPNRVQSGKYCCLLEERLLGAGVELGGGMGAQGEDWNQEGGMVAETATES